MEGIAWLLMICGGCIASSLVLYGLFLFGYWLAWTDFKPKPATPDEPPAHELSQSSEQTGSDQASRRNPLTDTQLGVVDLDEAPLPADVQRRRLLEEKLRQFALEQPDSTAKALRTWLHES